MGLDHALGKEGLAPYQSKVDCPLEYGIIRLGPENIIRYDRGLRTDSSADGAGGNAIDTCWVKQVTNAENYEDDN